METLPTNHFTKAQQFVPTIHRDVYSAVDPTQPSLSQQGKVVIITGASQGLGARVCTLPNGLWFRSFGHPCRELRQPTPGICTVVCSRRRQGHCPRCTRCGKAKASGCVCCAVPSSRRDARSSDRHWQPRIGGLTVRKSKGQVRPR